ncbi:hypothetical protein BD560DRAFT_423946 [Blakeslea trispora]|nr:hypothetical protein BD560DRAFT_423946 [Blakeslea trispora]
MFGSYVGVAEFLASDTFLETNTGKQGRPSQGGDHMKAKRYYVKNHMFLLQKRKLKRYHDKVKKWLSLYEYDSVKLMEAIQKSLNKYKRAHHNDMKERSVLFYAINQLRDDHYLYKMNEEADKYLKETFDQDLERKDEQVVTAIQELTHGHLLLIFKLCTLFSAFLLSRFLQNQCENDKEKMASLCSKEYAISYNHLK